MLVLESLLLFSLFNVLALFAAAPAPPPAPVSPTQKNSAAVIQTGVKAIEKEEKPLFQIDTTQEIQKIPDFPDVAKVDVRYPLIPPYSFAHIYWDNANTEMVYEIEEPALDANQKEVLDLLEEGIKELINLSFISVKDRKTVLIYLEKNIRILLTEFAIELTMESYLKIMYYIYRDFVGLNDLEPLMNDYYIEDIECNGVNSPVYLVHRKFRNVRTSLVYKDIHSLASFVEKLAQKCGKYVSYAEPLLDGSLPNGSRVNATYTTDVSSKGPTFTVRKFTSEPWGPLVLIQKNSIIPDILAYIWMLIEYENSFMVIGGTGTGKTTILNSLAFFIPPQARIVSIEDTRELQLEHENWLPSVSRAGVGLTNLLGVKYGEVSLFDLLKASFRQRPDYIIVGEVRGAEAYVLFQAMASGHPSTATMHAENVETLVRRLQTNPINLSGSLVMSLAAVVVMQQTRIKGKEVRKVASVDEIVDVKEVNEGGKVTTNNVFKWEPATDTFKFNPNSRVFNTISEHYGLTKEQVLNEFRLRTALLKEMVRRGITGYKDVQKAIHEYYKEPKDVLKRFGIIK
ncbi:type II/IV secretion system ATPase subunit [Candidatus Woesearchaeota archaeon]|nr:type II/IV secretion system ATPase subunit [Candidatus Woesearchaeota archaeon]